MNPNEKQNLPILYSFRRCPYAMRARMAIAYANQPVELREVLLKDKPKQLLDVSPKATVPVLVVNQQQVLAESLDIMLWALSKSDPRHWYFGLEEHLKLSINSLIQTNDLSFKPNLDRYKYAERYPENTLEYYQEQGAIFLSRLDHQLKKHQFLLSDQVTLADVAVFPFVRQFAFVNIQWFRQTEYTHLQRWLDYWLASCEFNCVMDKLEPWHSKAKPTIFPQ